MKRESLILNEDSEKMHGFHNLSQVIKIFPTTRINPQILIQEKHKNNVNIVTKKAIMTMNALIKRTKDLLQCQIGSSGNMYKMSKERTFGF